MPNQVVGVTYNVSPLKRMVERMVNKAGPVWAVVVTVTVIVVLMTRSGHCNGRAGL
jgi:hypothetical protein